MHDDDEQTITPNYVHSASVSMSSFVICNADDDDDDNDDDITKGHFMTRFCLIFFNAVNL